MILSEQARRQNDPRARSIAMRTSEEGSERALHGKLDEIIALPLASNSLTYKISPCQTPTMGTTRHIDRIIDRVQVARSAADSIETLDGLAFRAENLQLLVESDRVLIRVADGLVRSFGNEGRCYRMGGDEFIVTSTTLSYAEQNARLLSAQEFACKAIADEGICPEDMDISFAFGTITRHIATTRDLRKLERDVDRLMYVAKKSGTTPPQALDDRIEKGLPRA